MSQISFNQFPINWAVPGVYAEYSNAGNSNPAQVLPQKVLVVGQKLAAGIAASGVPILATSEAQAGRLVGRGSMLHHMTSTVLAGLASVPVWMLPLDDAEDSTASVRTLTCTGPATESGTVALYIGARRYAVGVASGMTSAQLATAIAAAVQADDMRLVEAAVPGGSPSNVTLTARNAGLAAGRISCILNRYSDERVPSGLGVAIGALTAGATDPVLADVLPGIQNIWYPTFVIGYTDAANTTALVAELNRRNGPIPQIEGVAFTAADDTVQNLVTLAAGRNSPFVELADANDFLDPPFKVAASHASVQTALAQTDPGLPETSQEMPGLTPKPEASRRSITDQQLLLAGGVSTTYIDDSGTPRAQRFTTTYRTDEYNLPDKTRFDICHTRLWAQTRFGLRLLFSKYSNWKLGKDGSIGDKVMTPALGRSLGVTFYKTYMDQGWYEGGAAFELFKSSVKTEVEPTDPNRMNMLFPPDFINQLRVTAILVQPVG